MKLSTTLSRVIAGAVCGLAIACSNPVETNSAPTSWTYDIVLTVDQSAYYTGRTTDTCIDLYCRAYRPDSGQMIGSLTLRAKSLDGRFEFNPVFGEPGDGPAVTYDTATFDDPQARDESHSLGLDTVMIGRSATNGARVLVTRVQLPGFNGSKCCVYDGLDLMGVIDSSGYHGTFSRWLDAHGRDRRGTFKTVKITTR